MNIAYVRVSTVEQNESRQIEGLKPYGIEKWFKEKVSAKDTNRPQLKAMIDFAREGDTIYVWDFSRLARSTKDLLDIVELMKTKGIHLKSIKESLDTTTPTGKLMLTMIGAINEFERANLLERQKEGIALAKAKGKYLGRKEVDIKDFDKHYKRYLNREVSKSALARELNISRPTLDKLIKEHKEEVHGTTATKSTETNKTNVANADKQRIILEYTYNNKEWHKKDFANMFTLETFLKSTQNKGLIKEYRIIE